MTPLKKFLNTTREYETMAIIQPKNLTRLCLYINDVRTGRLKERVNYRYSYLGFGLITQKELDALCHLAEKYLLFPDEGIFNHMGEIHFVRNIEKKEERVV